MKQTDQHHNKLGYTIPEGYFEASKKEMLAFLGANKSSKNTINKKSSYALLSYSIIGVFLVGLFFVKQNTWQEIKTFEQGDFILYHSNGKIEQKGQYKGGKPEGLIMSYDRDGEKRKEFKDRINGFSYEEIAANGGGILNSAKTLQTTSENDLYEQSKVRLEEVMALGTGAIEIKSGYGLSPESELKMLRVIKRFKKEYPIPIKATFLAAHALPKNFAGDTTAFLNDMLTKVLPVIKKENLATAIDVFCEKGYFSIADTKQVLKEAKDYGLIPKLHVNQFNAIGGVSLAVKYNARSVDHLEHITEDDIEALKNSKPIPVALN